MHVSFGAARHVGIVVIINKEASNERRITLLDRAQGGL